MASNRKTYLAKLRRETAYPAYRLIVLLIAILGYVGTGIYGLGVLGLGMNVLQNDPGRGGKMIIGGLLTAVLGYACTRFWYEAGHMLADLVDSVTATHARNDEKPRATSDEA